MIKKLIGLFVILIIIYLIYQFWPIKDIQRFPSSKTVNQNDCIPFAGGGVPTCKGLWGIKICVDKKELFYDGEICKYCEQKCFGVLTYEIPKLD